MQCLDEIVAFITDLGRFKVMTLVLPQSPSMSADTCSHAC